MFWVLIEYWVLIFFNEEDEGLSGTVTVLCGGSCSNLLSDGIRRLVCMWLRRI